jgi:hypothetical protein
MADEISTPFLHGQPLVQTFPNRSQCFTQELNESYSVFDSLLTGSSLEQFQIQLGQYFGALANDPIVRVAIAIRLQTQYDVLTLLNTKPPVDQKILNAFIAFLLAPDFTGAHHPYCAVCLYRPTLVRPHHR